MDKLRTDSPLCRIIVRSFLDFLDSVKPAPRVDLEGLEVARDCLTEVFKLDSVCINDEKPDVLVNLFSSLEVNEDQKAKSDVSHRGTLDDAPSSSSAPDTNGAKYVKASKLGDDMTTETQFAGVINNKLLGQYIDALQKINFFKNMPDGKDVGAQIAKVTRLFLDAVKEMERSVLQAVDYKNLAEAFQSQGNNAMQSKQYPKAVELYSIAICLCEDNAVYYCKRAAAYNGNGKHYEAIADCVKCIKIDRSYMEEACTQLHLAYRGLGKIFRICDLPL